MMNNKTIQLIIPLEHKGERVDKTVATLLPEFSRSQLNRWLKDGLVLLNGKPPQSKDKVKGGEHISITPLLTDKLDNHIAQDIPLNIIYEDEELIILNKPQGLVVHPGAGNHDNTMLNALLHHEPGLSKIPRAGIIHRIDKDTSGLLVIAKTLFSHNKLVLMMQSRQIKRQYYALVNGVIIAGNTITTNMARSTKNRLMMSVSLQGKEAITHYIVKEKFKSHTLLDVSLETGRTHQIRVHMAHIGHPIVGDRLYGHRNHLPKQACKELIDLLQQFKRQALHAYQLSFSHPNENKPLTFNAPIPDDFNRLLSALRTNNG